MRTKGDYLSVTVGGTLGSAQPLAAALAARALRGAGFTVLALDARGRLLDEGAALRGAGKADRAVPVLVAVRGDVMTRHRWEKAGGRPRGRASPAAARLVALAGARGGNLKPRTKNLKAKGGGHGEG